MEVSLVAFVTMFSIHNLTESVSTRFKMFLFTCDQHVVDVQVKGDVVYFSFFGPSRDKKDCCELSGLKMGH